MAGFWDFLDEGLKNLGIRDEVDDLANALGGMGQGMGQDVQQAVQGVPGVRELGRGFGLMGEEMQRWSPQEYFGAQQKWQRPWEIAGDVLGQVNAPFE